MRQNTRSCLSGGGCVLLVLIFNIWIGAKSVQYLAEVFLHRQLPWLAAALIGLVGGELTIPAAIIVWILRLCGVPL